MDQNLLVQNKHTQPYQAKYIPQKFKINFFAVFAFIVTCFYVYLYITKFLIKMAKKQSTFTIDEDVKKSFKLQTIKDGIEMSDCIEQMMVNYVSTSKRLHLERGE